MSFKIVWVLLLDQWDTLVSLYFESDSMNRKSFFAVWMFLLTWHAKHCIGNVMMYCFYNWLHKNTHQKMFELFCFCCCCFFYCYTIYCAWNKLVIEFLCKTVQSKLFHILTNHSGKSTCVSNKHKQMAEFHLADSFSGSWYYACCHDLPGHLNTDPSLVLFLTPVLFLLRHVTLTAVKRACSKWPLVATFQPRWMC